MSAGSEKTLYPGIVPTTKTPAASISHWKRTLSGGRAEASKIVVDVETQSQFALDSPDPSSRKPVEVITSTCSAEQRWRWSRAAVIKRRAMLFKPPTGVCIEFIQTLQCKDFDDLCDF